MRQVEIGIYLSGVARNYESDITQNTARKKEMIGEECFEENVLK